MHEWTYAALGAVLVVAVFTDALATTTAVSEGAGPATRRITGLAWRALLRLHRPGSRSLGLSTAGVVLLVGTVLLWVLALWAGWTLVFLAGHPGVEDATTGAPADLADVVYYTGFSIVTLGVGDFVAAGDAFRVLTAVASLTGLFLITLAITYLLSVVAAVVDRRALAVQIGSLGSTPGQIAAAGWDGSAFSSAYVQHLVSLTGRLAISAEQQLAYPVLQYFHSRTPATAAPVAVAMLDDALLLLDAAVDPEARLGAATVAPARNAVERFLSTARATSAVPLPPPPPAPDPAPLQAAGVPLVAPGQLHSAVEAHAERRRTLARLVQGAGWSWPSSV